MTERRVVDHNVLGRDTLGLEVGFKNLVGGARIDVISTRQHPALHLFFLGQVIDSGNGLLVRRRAGIDDVALAFLAFILHGIEQNIVQLLEHRQN